MTGVYGIFCTSNNKLYVGSTSIDSGIAQRISTHFSMLKRQVHNNTYLQNSYNKYGSESFLTFIIEECSKDLCLVREQFYLDNYKPEFNIARCARAPMLGRKHTAETIQKLKSVKRSVEFCERVRTTRAGWNKGIPHSSLTRAKISKSKGGRAILCIELNKSFDSIASAARELELYPQNIWAVLQGNRLHTKNYTFTFLNKEVA